jgi:hypothetical protein
LKDGLTSSEYQGSLKAIVTIPPIAEAEYVASANRTKDIILFLSIYIIYSNLWKIKKLFGSQELVVELVGL